MTSETRSDYPRYENLSPRRYSERHQPRSLVYARRRRAKLEATKMFHRWGGDDNSKEYYFLRDWISKKRRDLSGSFRMSQQTVESTIRLLRRLSGSRRARELLNELELSLEQATTYSN